MEAELFNTSTPGCVFETSNTGLSSIWHFSVGGLRVGPIPSTVAFGVMTLLLIILRDETKKKGNHG
jgi:hypothetical protein